MTITGVLPVLQLPYLDDESIDWPTLRREVDFVFQNGAHGIVAAMVTEVLRLTDAERDELGARLVEFCAGRGPVVLSVGAESASQAVRHARVAEKVGASALMAIPPTNTRASSDEIVNYYERILGATSIPLLVQDASGYVGAALPIATQADLFRRHPARVMFKPEAQPLGPNLTLLREATGGEAAIFEGSGGIALLDSYQRGIAGTMPGAEIVWAIRAEWDALVAGDLNRATALQGLIAPLISLQHGLDGFLAVEKLLLNHKEIFPNRQVRGPVGFKLDAATEKEALRLYAALHEMCGQPSIS
jgi:dihydrodipicolinate synthase/N-acetylneuraminate lyase